LYYRSTNQILMLQLCILDWNSLYLEIIIASLDLKVTLDTKVESRMI